MFRNYTEDGPALLTDSDAKIRGHFLLENTSTTVANTLRRCILTHTRSVGFRADLTNEKDPGMKIRKNTGIIFNEMLAHRLTLVPLGVRNIDDFDPTAYECVLNVRNDIAGPVSADSMRHVTTSDFLIREKQADGTYRDLGREVTAALFPVDSITKDGTLITSLRPQWNSEQPAEEIDLTAYPVIGTGREFIGFCPVSQCSFENTPDPDPVRQERFFAEWLAAFKKVADPTSVPPETMEGYRKEWGTMAIQRCFIVDEKDQPNSFTFTVESVGIRPVQDIVAEGIKAVIELVSPYADADRDPKDLGISFQPVDSRMSLAVDVQFAGQEHTLGNLLQTLITELFLDTEAPDSPITFVAYKIRHPLHRVMTLRLSMREGAGDVNAVARQVIVSAAQRAQTIFNEIARGWAALVGGDVGAGGEGVAALEG